MVRSNFRIDLQLHDALAADPRITAAYLLGSAATGRLRPDSDIDLAVLPAAGLKFSLTDCLDLAAGLGPLRGRTVDVGVLGAHDVVYAAQAIAYGRCIFCRDRYQRDLFAATALGMYVNLKQERAEVERAYRIG